MTTKEPQFVPARYIGNHVVDLQQTGRAWHNIDGSKRTELTLTHGDTVMMPAAEVLGQTLLNLKDGQQLLLGPGRLVRKEDEGKTEEELRAMGYQWDAGRPDFEVIEAEPAKEARPAKQSRQPRALPTSLEIDASQIAHEEVR